MKKIVMIIICIISAFSLYISVISMHRLHTVSEKLSNDIVNSIISICRGLDIDYIQAEIQGAAFSDRSIFHQTEMFLQEISTQLDTLRIVVFTEQLN